MNARRRRPLRHSETGDRATPVSISTMSAAAKVNGVRHDLAVDPLGSAAEVIRDQLGLTGTKVVCGAGVCGACTVLLDDNPVASCTLPAPAVDGAAVRTIEDIGRDGLHPVQRAFLAHDGLQCGYCTPGFVVEAVAFHDRWRAQNDLGEPTREAITYALAGHLCRCGAYPGIYAAVAAACRGDFDDDTGSVAKGRPDGEEKVTGRARYTTDIRYPGMLVAGYLGSAHAHAAITAMRFDRAEAIDGVEAVIDVLTDPYRVARYAGQPLAAVAAVDVETARRALEAIEVSYEPLPFVIDPDEALADGAPLVFPEPRKEPANASEGPIPPARWNGNVRTPLVNRFLSHRRRRARRNLMAANGRDDLVVVDATYRTPGQTHTSLEPHGCVASWEGDRLTVHTSTQSVHLLMDELRAHYRLGHGQVTVRAEYVGGAFGAKQGLQLEHTTVADLARLTGRPVRLVHDREHEMTAGGYRPHTRVELAVVTDGNHVPLGITLRAYGSAGIAVQSQVAPWVRLTYRGPKDLRDFDVVTNTGPGRPMRAPSGPPAFWALETAMDELAHESGVDPIALRRRWDASDVRNRLYDWAEALPAWQRRRPAGHSSDRFRSGVGVAIGNWFTIFDNTTRIRLDATAGGVVARCAAQDMGNGTRSVIQAGVAETLGIDARLVEVDVGVSTHPPGPNSSGSRTTASVYPASIEAAELLQHRLVRAARTLGLERPRWEHGGIAHADGFVGLAELLPQLPEPISVTSRRRGGNGPLDLLGVMPSGSMGMSLFPKMTGAVAVVSVDVDTHLGRIIPRHVWLGVAAGKIVNRVVATSQCHGAIVQSLGLALTEERHYDPHGGRLLSANLEDYRIPGIGDVPPIDVDFDEEGFDKLKGSAGGLSELVALPTAPALGNAVFNATGWRPRTLPLVPRRVHTNLSALPE